MIMSIFNVLYILKRAAVPDAVGKCRSAGIKVSAGAIQTPLTYPNLDQP